MNKNDLGVLEIPPQQDGVLVLNKPSGPSSAACISRIKRLGQKKIGHAGTLDPLAQGVLLVLLGQATKLSAHLMADGEKVYSGIIRLGVSTDTWDILGKTLAQSSYNHVKETDIADVVQSWIGKSTQEVPAFSAAKHEGKPLYKLAREGKETPVKIKNIEISQAELLWVKFPQVGFRVTCSSGTYIRSLAHSLGTRLGTHATLEALTREYSHPFSLKEAYEVSNFTDNPSLLPECVLPVHKALPKWLKLIVSKTDEEKIRHGHSISYQAVEKQIENATNGFELVDFAEKPFQEGIKALLMNENEQTLALAVSTTEHGKEVFSVLRGLCPNS
ncbi:tRNA pseudouridine(55) synthase TruB [Desulfovibrio litoralis]|uniref:tRNA pseudouridine synthase B n=1 Tax=Desulfovibrio litoralis DSM 11393 TaxID=1121455 RepID=A0A1M7TJZ9_9BACT|nr:tRNA pseudouridine(55) synthase TruB [Desulfovibrio litoralis]SHN71050.1 tRNA pseudouridine synthase B [Desulfovibrio litoralis DSM 11393]